MDFMAVIKQEALCDHDVIVRIDERTRTYVVTHQSAERLTLEVPERDIKAGTDLRISILLWLILLHDPHRERVAA